MRTHTLRKRRTLYESLFDNMPDGLAYCRMVFDAHGHPIDFLYIRVNKNFGELTGLKDTEGKKVTELIHGIRDSNPEVFEIYGRVALGGEPERFETYIKPLARWFFISVYCPKKNFFVAVFQDITERKQIEKDLQNAKVAAHNVLEDLTSEKIKAETAMARSEILAKDLEKFKLAVDNVSDNIIITDPEGIVVYANKAVEKITGYKTEEVIGKKSGALWKVPMPPEYYQKMWDAIKNQKKTFIGELQNKRKNGEVYTAVINISPILNEKGEIGFFVGIERDITHEKEIDRAKSEFVSLASHQLRTPTVAIGWYAEMLLQEEVGDLNEKQKIYLKEIHHGNRRMIELVNALLSVSRIDLGTFVIQARPIQIAVVADDVLEELQTQISDKGLKVEKEYAKGTASIESDRQMIRIIFQNLLSNAVAYTPPQGKISIQIINQDTGVRIAIGDSGCGIPQNAKAKIYTKFFRADNARAIKTDGTGLGLYITKSIVEALGGTIGFESKEGEGTVFSVDLPNRAMAHKKSEQETAPQVLLTT